MTIIPAPGADLATDELLPCPFCGSAAEFQIFEFSGVPMCSVRCCVADTGRSGSKKMAAERWNRRASLAAVPASEPVAKITYDPRDSDWHLHMLAEPPAEAVEVVLYAASPRPLHAMAPFAPSAGQQDASDLEPYNSDFTGHKYLRWEQAPTVAALVSGMPDLASLQRYRPTSDQHYADFPPGPMEQHPAGEWLHKVDVERLLNPAGETK